MSGRERSAYYSAEELCDAGFRSIGSGVTISRKASLYALSGSVGSHVRIDDFCVLKGRIEIGSYVHVAAHCLISGVRGTVRLSDFSTLSDSVSIYTGSDDYRADALSSSTVPAEFLRTIEGDVVLGRAALVGSHTVLLPGTELGDAASVGAQCVIHGRVAAGAILRAKGAGGEVVGQRDVAKILGLADVVLGRRPQAPE